MYSIGKTYKIQTKKGIHYTGKIVEEDHLQIKIHTIRGEELILNKDELIQCLLAQDRTGGDTVGRH